MEIINTYQRWIILLKLPITHTYLLEFLASARFDAITIKRLCVKKVFKYLHSVFNLGAHHSLELFKPAIILNAESST